MSHEVTAIIDGEVRILVLTSQEHSRVIHRSRNSPRKKIGPFHKFLMDKLKMLHCPEIKEEEPEAVDSVESTEEKAD